MVETIKLKMLPCGLLVSQLIKILTMSKKLRERKKMSTVLARTTIISDLIIIVDFTFFFEISKHVNPEP